MNFPILHEIHNLLGQNPELFACAGFLIGLLLGNWLAIGRDKRKEFNDIAQPIREILLKERNGLSPHFAGLGDIDADRLENVLHWWQRGSFRCRLNAYRKEKESAVIQEPIYGCVSYANTDGIIGHIEHLLRYVERK